MQKSTWSFSASFQALSPLNLCSSIRACDWLLMREESIGSGGRVGWRLWRAPSRIYCCIQPCKLSSSLLKKGLLLHLSHHWNCQGLEDSGEVSSSDCSAQPGLPAEASVSSWASPRLHLLRSTVSRLWGLGWCLSKEAGHGVLVASFG